MKGDKTFVEKVEGARFSRLRKMGLLRFAAQRVLRPLNDRGSIFPIEKVGTAPLLWAAVGSSLRIPVHFDTPLTNDSLQPRAQARGYSVTGPR
jgi:hypothetical protein